MSFGMNIVTQAPRPAARQWATAITTYAELTGPEYDPDSRGIKRWLNGVKFTPFGCDKILGALFDPCVERTSTFQNFDTESSFDPFLAEVGVTCSTLGYDKATLEKYVIAHTEISRSSVLAAQVERAAYTTTNPSLATGAVTIGNTDQSLMGALLAIEAGLADLLDGGAGMVHIPAGVLAVLHAQGGVRYDQFGRPFTATGHLIVADAGYLGVSPMTQEVVDGEVWIYGSGPVFAKYDDLLRFQTDPWDDLSNGLLHNDREVKAEMHGIAIFDTCSIVAAMVNTADGDFTEGSGDGSTSSSASITVVADSAANEMLAAVNASRIGLLVFNDSTEALYLKYGVGATTSDFTVKILGGGYWEMPSPIFTGRIDGTWGANSTGAARITELV